MLLMPPGSGPDEPGHLVRSGAVVRGDFSNRNYYELPDRYQVAEPGCYAFQPTVPVGCSAVPEHTGATLELPTNAGPYPVWGHAVFGVLTVLPGLDPLWWARIAGGLVATALVGWSFVRTARVVPTMSAGLLLALTPTAWSTFGTVNPSSIVIAGAVALWIGLFTRGDSIRTTVDAAGAGWLTAAGWTALVLPRRDGLVWACITLVIALAATGRTTPDWWRELRREQQALIGVSTLITMVWGVLSDSRSTQMVVLAPALIVALEAWRWWWHRPVHTTATRIGSSLVLGAVGLLATYVLIDTRPGGWDTDLAVDVLMQTDDNLVESIGVLGWLDTAVPAGAVHLWLIAIGMSIAIALGRSDGMRLVMWASVLGGTVVTTSWVLELVQGNDSGLYWQGRYSIPLIVGVPLLLLHDRTTQRSGFAAPDAIVGGIGLVVVNIAAWAAARRFGVGTSGSFLPWRWDTVIQPVPPLLLLTVHAAASVWLWTLLIRPRRSATVNDG
jgi:hypothetical protein